VTDQSPRPEKIFPRNLTARAAHVVRGNPVTTRPESGVENTHPGLELDQRNLDRHCLPGLELEFQFLDGARVVAIAPAGAHANTVPQPADAGNGLRLLYVYGYFGDAPNTPSLRELGGLDGYEVLRALRDLEAAPLVAVIGRVVTPAHAPDPNALNTYMATLQQMQAGQPDPASISLPLVRDAGGLLLLAAIGGTRNAFVGSDGVLDPTLLPPGELTRSLCAPWQWDFADCGCHYWASSRPDIVIGRDGGEQVLNFQRADRTPPDPLSPPATDYDAWTSHQITQQAMINNWQSLPFVLSERETDRLPAPPVLPRAPKLDHAQIGERLRYLAAVEHALTVNYLYAHYSIDAPFRLPPGEAPNPPPLFRAAREIFMIAVDEMRHFRWVNEALVILGEPLAFGRAETFYVFDRNENRKRRFAIKPLTRELLETLIEIEAPSRTPRSPEIDGMYTDILLSVPHLGAAGVPAEDVHRLAEVVKLIIDEGHSHYERLLTVQGLLACVPESTYLRLGDPAPLAEGEGRDLQQLGDLFYRTLLDGIIESFHQPLKLRAKMLEHAHRIMKNLHELAHAMAARHITPLFTLPDGNWCDSCDAAKDTPAPRTDEITALRAPLAEPLTRLAQSADPALSFMALRHAADIDSMVVAMRAVAGGGTV